MPSSFGRKATLCDHCNDWLAGALATALARKLFRTVPTNLLRGQTHQAFSVLVALSSHRYQLLVVITPTHTRENRLLSSSISPSTPKFAKARVKKLPERQPIDITPYIGRFAGLREVLRNPAAHPPQPPSPAERKRMTRELYERAAAQPLS